MPATPSNTIGAACGVPSSVISRPGGLVSSVTVRTIGTMSRYTEWVRPPASVTVRWIRYQTLLSVSPTVGMVNDPPVTFVVSGTKGWEWVLWWKSTCHVKEPAGRVPSSGSEPVPAYTITSPAVYVAPAGG